MNKVEKSINTLVNHVLDNISKNHDIEITSLQETIAPLLENSPFERCQGLVASKNNRPVCRSKVLRGFNYCRRHVPLFEDGSDSKYTQERLQCTATVNNGSRCLKNTKEGHDICGIHLVKQVYQQRSQQNNIDRVHCVYYEDDEDDVDFCSGFAVTKDEWFCTKHQHLQTMYERVYGSKNLHEYKNNSNNKQVQIIEKFINNNGY